MKGPRRERIGRAWVALSAGLYLVLGVWFLAAPEALEIVRLSAAEGTARAELRAMYGGLELGIGAFLLACAAGSGAWVQAGVALTALTLLGLGLARGVGIALDETAPIMAQLMAVELAWGSASLLGFALLRRAQPGVPGGSRLPPSDH